MLSANKEYVGFWNSVLSELYVWSELGVKEGSKGSIGIANIKSVAPLFYLHKIYSPLKDKEIESLENLFGSTLPNKMRAFYKFANGVRLFNEISIYLSLIHI